MWCFIGLGELGYGGLWLMEMDLLVWSNIVGFWWFSMDEPKEMESFLLGFKGGREDGKWRDESVKQKNMDIL